MMYMWASNEKKNVNIFFASLKSMKKEVGSGVGSGSGAGSGTRSGSISQKYGSEMSGSPTLLDGLPVLSGIVRHYFRNVIN